METMQSLTCFQLHDLFKKKPTPEEQWEIIAKLQEWGLIPREGTYLCPKGHPYKLIKDSRSVDGWMWRCTHKIIIPKKKSKICGINVSIRKDTYFDKSHLSVRDIMLFTHFWVKMTPPDFIKSELQLSKQTITNWALLCREIIILKLLVHKDKIGGPEKIVEIDESRLGQRTYCRRRSVEGQWVFGGYERGSGKCFLCPVEKRDTETLLTVIKNYIKPGTTVISDFWKAYDCLQNEEFTNLRVNHSFDFKDPETGAHTKHVKSTWRYVKAQLPQYSRKRDFFFGCLAKSIFLKQCKTKDVNPFFQFVQWAADVHNPLESHLPETEPSGSTQANELNESDLSDIEI